MITQFDETRWPELTAFRQACLDGRTEVMEAIAARGHDWYGNENPDASSMQQLSLTFQAQHWASENELDRLRDLVGHEPWVVNQPWTAQGWLPITQACSHGERPMFEFLLSVGADPTLEVGDPDDRGTVVDMARYSGHNDLATWLQSVIDER